jgi:hypothetical protein
MIEEGKCFEIRWELRGVGLIRVIRLIKVLLMIMVDQAGGEEAGMKTG